MTSYQKLKAENKRLRDELCVVIDRPSSIQSLQIKMRHNMARDMEKFILFGVRTEPKNFQNFPIRPYNRPW
jgi:hypothetical protein